MSDMMFSIEFEWQLKRQQKKIEKKIEETLMQMSVEDQLKALNTPPMRHLPWCSGDARNYCQCETEQVQTGERIDVDHQYWLDTQARLNHLEHVTTVFLTTTIGLLLTLLTVLIF